MSTRLLVGRSKWCRLQRSSGSGYKVRCDDKQTYRNIHANVPNNGSWSIWIDVTATCQTSSPDNECDICFEIEVYENFIMQIRGKRRKGSDITKNEEFVGRRTVNLPRLFRPGCRDEYAHNQGGWTTTGSGRKHDECPPIRRYSNSQLVHENRVQVRVRRPHDECTKSFIEDQYRGPCREHVRQLCQRDDFAFGEFCNHDARRHFEHEVLHAYNHVVNRWTSGHRGSAFDTRGWEVPATAHGGQNMLNFCNTMVDATGEGQNRCDEWFMNVCQSGSHPNVGAYPWCACMTDRGYNMSYYDPEQTVFGNPNITGKGPDGTVIHALPDEPYCFVDACRNNPNAYRTGKNRRGEHGCPICVNVVSLDNVNFINSNITQVCDVGDYDTSPTPLSPSDSPARDDATNKTIEWVKEHKEPIIGGFVLLLLLGFLFFVLLTRVRKRRLARRIQRESTRKGLAMATFFQT